MRSSSESTGKLKTVTGPSGKTVAQVVTPEEEMEMKKKGAKIAPMEEDHHENPNDDSNMAKSQLYAIAKYAIELLQLIKDGDQLDAWVQAKITKAADYVDAVQHYLEGEKYLDNSQEESEEELAEDYVPRTKEDLVFQYLRDAWQFGALKGKDVNPDEELSTMADSLLANLPDYDAAELDEIKKAEFEKIKPGKELQLRGYGVVTVVANDGIVMKIKDSLDKVHTINLGQYNEKFLKEDGEIDDKNFSKKDAAKEKGFVAQSNALQAKAARKKALKPILDKLEKAGTISRVDGKLKINDMDAYKKAVAAINEVLAETKATCCGKCGRTHVKSTECKKPFLTGQDHCRVR